MIWSDTVLTAFFLYLHNLVTSVPIDNGLEIDPEIKCGEDSMTIVFQTKREFEGNVYINGRFNDKSCKVSGTGQKVVQIQVSYTGACGIRRKRQVAPVGMTIESTVVIMFHRSVITKVDRAFNIQCFYMQADKRVTANLAVSDITTNLISSAVRMPNCTYQVLQSPTSTNVIKYAQVGDQVYHKWNCVGGDSEMFCITVHSCAVDDGQGQNLTLIDNTGCAQDRYLLQNLEYLSDTMAGRESHVFKFADKATLYFNCQIRLVTKDGNGPCPRPQCPELTRGKRDTTVMQMLSNSMTAADNANLDVYSNRLTVLDIKELEPGSISDIKAADDDSKHKSAINHLNSANEDGYSIWCFKPMTSILTAVGALLLVFTSGCLFGGGLVVRYKSKRS